MQRAGRTVQFVDAASGADILIGRRPFISASGHKIADGATVAISSAEKRRVLAITEPYQVDAMLSPWNPLLIEAAAANSTEKRTDRTQNAVPLAALGLRQGLREVITTADWSFQLTDADLPARKLPRSLRLDFLAPPLGEERTWMIFVYLNDILIQGERVSGGTRPIGIEALLPAQDRTGRYAFRVVISRQGEEGECLRHTRSMPIQLLDSSRVELEEREIKVNRFSQIPGLMRSGMTVHVPKAADSGAAILQRLMALSKSFGLNPNRMSLSSDGAAPASGKPFVWIGGQAPGSLTGPVSLEIRGPRYRRRYESQILEVREQEAMLAWRLLRRGHMAAGCGFGCADRSHCRRRGPSRLVPFHRDYDGLF